MHFRAYFLLIIWTVAVVVVQGTPSPSIGHYEQTRRPPRYPYPATPAPAPAQYVHYESPAASASCKQCKPATHCKSELDIRDSDVPKEVAIPSVDYQIVYKDKPYQFVKDFQIEERPVPVPVQLQDERINVVPTTRNVDKVVVVRVPRVTENVVVKRLDRIKLVTEYRTKPKLIKVQNVRQVPETVKVTLAKDVVRKTPVGETTKVPVPVRVANQVHVDIQRVDKPVTVPSIQYRFCETIQEIKVKGDCPTAEPQPLTTARPQVVGYLPPDDK